MINIISAFFLCLILPCVKIWETYTFDYLWFGMRICSCERKIFSMGIVLRYSESVIIVGLVTFLKFLVISLLLPFVCNSSQQSSSFAIIGYDCSMFKASGGKNLGDDYRIICIWNNREYMISCVSSCILCAAIQTGIFFIAEGIWGNMVDFLS